MESRVRAVILMPTGITFFFHFDQEMPYVATKIAMQTLPVIRQQQKQKTHQQISDDKITSNPHTMN